MSSNQNESQSQEMAKTVSFANYEKRRQNTRQNKKKKNKNKNQNGIKSTQVPNRVLSLSEYEKRVKHQKESKEITNKKEMEDAKRMQKKRAEKRQKRRQTQKQKQIQKQDQKQDQNQSQIQKQIQLQNTKENKLKEKELTNANVEQKHADVEPLTPSKVSSENANENKKESSLTRMKKFNNSAMAKELKLLQQNGIECWFHRETQIGIGPITTEPLCLGIGITPKFFNNNYNGRVLTLTNQIFASDNVNQDTIKAIRTKIGDYPVIRNIDITFDLLSSNAFEEFNIRTTAGEDRKFTHWIPLYINKEHGKLSMSLMESYILRIFSDFNINYTQTIIINKNSDNNNNNNNNNEDEKENTNENNKNNKKNKENQIMVVKSYHPYLALYCVANMMKSLIVSLMKTSEHTQGKVKLDYCISVLETYLHLHHLLLAIYYHNKKQLKPLIQDEINMFFKAFDIDKQRNYQNRQKYNINDNNNNNGNDRVNNNYNSNKNKDSNSQKVENTKFFDCRRKSCIPDYDVFLMFLTLWEQDNKNSDNGNNNINDNNSKYDWDNGIGASLLDESFTRQVKLLLNQYPKFVNNENYNNKLDKYEKDELMNERRLKMFEVSNVSRRLFMFEYFFLTKVCQTFGTLKKGSNGNSRRNRVSPKDKYFEYNDSNGLLSDRKLAKKLQLFVKNSHSCKSYEEFFQTIDIVYPGDDKVSMWLTKCLKTSERRRYHKKDVYETILKKQALKERQAVKEKETIDPYANDIDTSYLTDNDC